MQKSSLSLYESHVVFLSGAEFLTVPVQLMETSKQLYEKGNVKGTSKWKTHLDPRGIHFFCCCNQVPQIQCLKPHQCIISQFRNSEV